MKVSRDFRKNAGFRLAYRFGGGWSFFPIAFFLSVNNVCNLRCRMCDVGQKKKDTIFYKNIKPDSGLLTLADWRQFVDSVTPWKPSIDIVGTEPLLYKELVELLQYIKERGLICHLTTNGVLLEQFAESLAAIDLDGLFVSIDGYESLHDEVRGVPGTFQKATKGVVAYHEAMNRNGRNSKIHATTTISPINHNGLLKTAQELMNYPFSSITMNHFSFLPNDLVELCHQTYGDRFNVEASSLAGVELDEVDVDVLWEEVIAVQALSQSVQVPLAVAPNFSKDEMAQWYKEPLTALRPEGYCDIPWRCAGISANGDVLNIFRCPYPAMGNIKEIPFPEIWNKKQYCEFRKRLKAEKYTFCTRCRRSFNNTL